MSSFEFKKGDLVRTKFLREVFSKANYDALKVAATLPNSVVSNFFVSNKNKVNAYKSFNDIIEKEKFTSDIFKVSIASGLYGVILDFSSVNNQKYCQILFDKDLLWVNEGFVTAAGGNI